MAEAFEEVLVKRGILIFVFAYTVSICLLSAQLGKHTADRWYAQHWHPNVRLSDVMDENSVKQFSDGMQPTDVIAGHDNTATFTTGSFYLFGNNLTVSGKNVAAIACSKDTSNSIVLARWKTKDYSGNWTLRCSSETLNWKVEERGSTVSTQ